MKEYFDIIVEGFEAGFGWFDSIQIGGFSVLDLGVIVLFLSCVWRFLLSPLFGVSGGSLSTGLSDTVSANRSHNDRKEVELRRLDYDRKHR